MAKLVKVEQHIRSVGCPVAVITLSKELKTATMAFGGSSMPNSLMALMNSNTETLPFAAV